LHKQASDWNDWEGENYLLVTMARFYADQKRWHEAEILLKRAIAEDRHPNPYFRQLSSYYGDPLARALEEQGKHAEAEQIRQQMHANPWSQPAHKRS